MVLLLLFDVRVLLWVIELVCIFTVIAAAVIGRSTNACGER